MDKDILDELRKIEAEIDKLSKLKLDLEAKAQKIKEEIKTQNTKASPDVKSQPKNTEKKYKSKSKKQRKKEKREKIKSKRDNKSQPKKAKKPSNTKIIPAKKFVKAPKTDKNQTKKKRTPTKTDKNQAKKKKKQPQSEPLNTIPFGKVPDTGEIQVSEPMSLIGMYILGIVDRIEQALDGRSELVTIHTGEGNHGDTAEYNGSFISARSYYDRLEVAAGGTVLLKICEEAKKEADLINANDERALKAFEEGNLVSNILVSKQSEILTRLFMWVFDSDQPEEALSEIDALFPFTEAFGGTKYEAELNTALDEAANEDLSGGIEREEYDPKNTFIGYTTGREFVILPDDTIQPINDSNIKFEKGSDGLYEIGGKKYTLKEAIERL